ncbi:MAG TPA: NosD domain-containing protein [Gemmatimonadales bacterium]|nr:NosD domain-containing protein [Gemmatimonadales bacterium]
MRSLLLLLLPLALAGARPAGGITAAGVDPCLRPTRAGTAVKGDVRICPGRYRLADPREQGVIVVAGSGTRLDLTGVTLESGDSVPARFTGIGVLSRGVDQVTIVGGTVRGYRYGIRVEGGRGHRIHGADLSGSRAQALRSTPQRYDEGDWLDIFRPDTFETYGAGLYLKYTDGASVTSVVARRAQNGIMLADARGSYVADNDVSANSGWGLALWQSSRNTIVRNKAHHVVRCESPAYSRGCDSAGLLLRQQSDSNTIVDNDLTYSGDGFFLSGQPPYVRPSVGNVVVRNDATGAYHNAFEATFSWNNTFLENRADSAAYGFWLGYSSGSTVRGNSIVGSREAGIAIEHGEDNTLAANTIVGGATGIHLFAPRADGPASRNVRVDDNLVARVTRGLVLERTTMARVRGNVFDGVGEGLVADSAGRGTAVTGNVFLRASGAFVRAPVLAAGGNFWAAPDAAATAARVQGQIRLEPWRPATDAGF